MITSRRIALDFSAQLLHPRLRRCEQIIKPRAPAERTRPGTRTHPQAILRQGVERHQPSLNHRRDALRQKPFQNCHMGDPEGRQAVIVHRHPAT
jgi:hypothetical protein